MALNRELSKDNSLSFGEIPPIAAVSFLESFGSWSKNDCLADLGCGSGRFLILACAILGIRGVGMELIPARARAGANAIQLCRRLTEEQFC